ncbi:hypothetical protein EVAR_49253_1 [Eumeta japonica]|uniref:Uncharacterized protein n=1 Tax=Eumeta variegata TaxID=151549 RepID=A0A4C1YJT1_EUMVA|nr:hypothetical protein EVAR_49253_1 [Eumeta japonica]
MVHAALSFRAFVVALRVPTLKIVFGSIRSRSELFDILSSSKYVQSGANENRCIPENKGRYWPEALVSPTTDVDIVISVLYPVKEITRKCRLKELLMEIEL